MAYRLVLLIQSWAQPCCCSVTKHVTPQAVAPPGSCVHGVSWARMLEWAAISFSRGSFWPRDGTCVSYIGQADSLPLSHQGSPYPSLHAFQSYFHTFFPKQLFPIHSCWDEMELKTSRWTYNHQQTTTTWYV